MNPYSSDHPAQLDQRIAALVSEYLDRRQAGEKLTPEGFVGEHPEAAEELRPYLAGLPLIVKACSTAGNASARWIITSRPREESLLRHALTQASRPPSGMTCALCLEALVRPRPAAR